MDLRSFRLEKGWSQEQLADISGLSARTIQRLEKGENAGLETLKALAVAFEVPLSKLQASSLNQDEAETMKIQTDGTPESFIPRRWKGVFLHLLTFMVVITWLLILTYFFEIEAGWVYWVGYVWAMGIGIQAWNTANPDKED